MDSIRVSVEIGIEKGSLKEVIEAVKGNFPQIAGFIADTIVGDEVEGEVKLKKLGAHVHVHDRDACENGDWCSGCVSHANSHLPEIPQR